MLAGLWVRDLGRVPGGGVNGAGSFEPPGLGCVSQVAAEGNLNRSSSPLAGCVSSVMYLARCTAHSSFCSAGIAPTSRVMAASLGKMPTTLVQRLISLLSRSGELAERSQERRSQEEFT